MALRALWAGPEQTGKMARFAMMDDVLQAWKQVNMGASSSGWGGRVGKPGRVIVASDANVRDHEYATALALARETGYDVEFVRKSDDKRVTTPDALFQGRVWEFKAPISGKSRVIEKHLREALHQSHYIVFDGVRMKGLPDSSILGELRRQLGHLRSIKGLIYVGKDRKVLRLK